MMHWRGIPAGLTVYSDEPFPRVDVTAGRPRSKLRDVHNVTRVSKYCGGGSEGLKAGAVLHLERPLGVG